MTDRSGMVGLCAAFSRKLAHKSPSICPKNFGRIWTGLKHTTSTRISTVIRARTFSTVYYYLFLVVENVSVCELRRIGGISAHA